MNKKGKNKKGKVPNPTPSQEEKTGDKDEDVGVIGDKGDLGKSSDVVENVPEKTESVKEDRVPEIVSEVIAAPVDTKDEETPKKPKRNRGKKKKGKEDEFDDNLDESSKESTEQPPIEESKVETLETEKEPLDVPIVTPTARKKKNKKKNVEQKIDEPIAPDQESTLAPVNIKDTIKEPEVTDMLTKPEISTQSESAEQEVKPSKKKNKKKKRNDSERSDREEISCTAAFQKLMDVSDETSEVKTQEIVADNVITTEDIKLETEIQIDENITPQEAVVEKDTCIVPEVMQSKETDTQQMLVTEGKSKKKNKKDKKHIPKLEETTPLPDIPVSESPVPVEKEQPTDNVIKEDIVKETVTVEKPETLVEKTSPKPKAKIAKPVEKKRKGKQDNQPAESVPEEIVSTPLEAPKTQETFSEVLFENAEIKITEKEKISEMEIKNTPEEKPAEISITTAPALSSEQLKEITLEDFEPLNLSEKAMGKKRKKGPKIPKTPDVSFEILEPNIEADKQPAAVVSETIIEQLPVSELASKEEQASKSEIPTSIDIPIDSKPAIEPTIEPGVKDHILLTPEFAEKQDFIKTDTTVSEKAEDTQKFETKSGKKRKKSPKPPKKEKVSESGTPTTTDTRKSTEECLPSQDATKEMGEKIDASNITRMYDIEISSIKADESEGSICDTIPDVTYPRASSQQLTDDNNNDTVIREIFPVSELTQDVPVEQCIKVPKADKTPTPKEHNVSPSKEEKTDIKSKMMEVNQDMEELRLSIERSLAELTAMEKSEEVIETHFEESKIKTEDNVTKVEDVKMTKKQEEHEKMIEISDAEKSAIEKPVEEIKSLNIEQDTTKTPDKTVAEQLFPLSKELFVVDTTSQAVKPESSKKPVPKIEDIITELAFTKEAVDLKSKTDIKMEPILPINIDATTPAEAKPAEAVKSSDIAVSSELLTEQKRAEEKPATIAPIVSPEEKKVEKLETENKDIESKPKEEGTQLDTPPVCPARKDHKNKHKKKKCKQDSQVTAPQPAQSGQSTGTSQSTTQETKKEEKTDNKTDNKSEKKSDSKESKGKGKQQASNIDQATEKDLFSDMDYEPIDNFEDALTSSVDDVNKTFEMIVNESQEQSNPKINIIAPDEEKTPVSPPKNLLGHPDIPVPSNRRDYKKEKNKIPNEITAKVKIKDAVDVEKKQSKNTQTVNKLKDLKDCRLSDNEEFVYKYSFRKVFLQTACHVCKKDLAGCRVPCCYCNLVFYCGIKHKDEDWPQHQALCFAVSTIGHLKDQKHIYGDAKNITGHDYRLIRMQMIVSCEKILKRRLVPWEQEALLYPRICAHVPCREWRQMKLTDCAGCGQISYCTDNPDHCPKSHARWCKSYSLYQKLVCYQQTKGRLEPKLPTKVMQEHYEIPEKINEVFAGMYEEKIDMNDIQYAALTQLATAPLTAAYCHQLCRNKNITANGYKKSSFTIHVVGAELQFEADALNKWEVFFLHLRPDLQELKVVLINYNLNPSNLPLELLGKIKLCENCRQNKRRVILSFQDKRTYADYKSSEDFVVPDIVCAFNPSIQRSSVYNGKDPWPSTVNVILKQKIPFIITAYTITELHKDCIRIKECSEIGYSFISEPKYNNFASVRPDRNFISDDEMPLLFKNYCFAIICG